MLKKIMLALLVILLVMQAFRPTKNLSANTENDISVSYAVPTDVKTILAKACNDCHSNKTEYPWYANIQPVAFWLNDHVVDGKRHMNFNEFNKYRIAKQYKKLEECIDEVKDGEMPLESYTMIHKNAILTEAEKTTLTNWCMTVRDSIKAKYPADSLVLPKRK
ncbi:MAG: cytochrome C [Chitinophagaceae bacterium BSSC1]|nr:MAG: cytochrome C [Chitinophagaceae bacterium BSSC1]